MPKNERYINIIFVLLFTAYSAYSILFKQAGMFFIIYLFWFDEVIRNISLLVQVKIARLTANEDQLKTLARSRSTILSRFFFLFVYSVFIIIVFGIFFHLGEASDKELIENVRIIFFRDPVFNICLCIAVTREILLIRASYASKRITSISNAMDGHIVTMHLSILLGGLMFFLTRGKDAYLSLPGTFAASAIILPFLVIKLIVDIYSINKTVVRVNS